MIPEERGSDGFTAKVDFFKKGRFLADTIYWSKKLQNNFILAIFVQ